MVGNPPVELEGAVGADVGDFPQGNLGVWRSIVLQWSRWILEELEVMENPPAHLEDGTGTQVVDSPQLILWSEELHSLLNCPPVKLERSGGGEMVKCLLMKLKGLGKGGVGAICTHQRGDSYRN